MKTTCLVFALIACGKLCNAQSADSINSSRSLPPATKLEAFQPKAGEVSTMGYSILGNILPGMVVKGSVEVDVRVVKDSHGAEARGAVVEIGTGGPLFRSTRSFIDEEELPELVKGIDALLSVKTNPTTFKSYQVRYRTRGAFEILVFGTGSGKPQYSIATGRVLPESRSINEAELRQIRDWINSAKAALLSESK